MAMPEREMPGRSDISAFRILGVRSRTFLPFTSNAENRAVAMRIFASSAHGSPTARTACGSADASSACAPNA